MTSRLTDPNTSHNAAALIEPHTTRIEMLILEFLVDRASGASTRQMAYRLGIDFATVTPRMAPLARLGLVAMTDQRVKSPVGKGSGRVWVITSKGRAAMSTTKT